MQIFGCNLGKDHRNDEVMVSTKTWGYVPSIPPGSYTYGIYTYKIRL